MISAVSLVMISVSSPFPLATSNISRPRTGQRPSHLRGLTCNYASWDWAYGLRQSASRRTGELADICRLAWHRDLQVVAVGTCEVKLHGMVLLRFTVRVECFLCDSWRWWTTAAAPCPRQDENKGPASLRLGASANGHKSR